MTKEIIGRVHERVSDRKQWEDMLRGSKEKKQEFMFGKKQREDTLQAQGTAWEIDNREPMTNADR